MKIAANFARSSSGCAASSASCSTRSLKSTQESSRLKESSASARSSDSRGAGNGSSAVGRNRAASASLSGGWFTRARRRGPARPGRRAPPAGRRPCSVRAPRRRARASADGGVGEDHAGTRLGRRLGALGDRVLQARAEALALQVAPERDGSGRRAGRGAPAGRPRARSARARPPRAGASRRAPDRGRARRRRAGAARPASASRSSGDERLDARELDVAVVDLAEQVLQLLRALARGLRVRAEARLGRRPRGRSAAAWPRSACRAARSRAAGSRTAGTNAHSSSSRTRTSRSALSASGPRGVQALDAARLHVTTPCPGWRPAGSGPSTTPSPCGCSPSPAGGATIAGARRPRAPRRRLGLGGSASCPRASSASSARRVRRSISSARSSAAASRALPSDCSARVRSMKTLDAGTLVGPDGGRELLEREQLDVRVAALAERVGELLDLRQHGAQRLAREARLVDLQHGAQAAGRDAHRVHALDVAGVEDAGGVLVDLLGAHGDRPGGGLAERHRAVQPWDLACLGHRLPSIIAPSRRAVHRVHRAVTLRRSTIAQRDLGPPRDPRPRPAQVLRRARGRPRHRLRGRRRRGLRPARAPTAPGRRRRSRSSRATGARSGGIVSVLGHDPGERSRALRERVGIVLQSLRDVPPHDACARRSRHWAGLLPAPARRRRGHRDRRAAARRRDALARTLSGGQQRRLDLALALVGDPELDLPRRADDRLRPGRAPRPRGTTVRSPAGARQDRPAHDALPRRGAGALRPRRDRQGRADPRRGPARRRSARRRRATA